MLISEIHNINYLKYEETLPYEFSKEEVIKYG